MTMYFEAGMVFGKYLLLAGVVALGLYFFLKKEKRSE